MKMERKLVKQGRNALTMTIPSDWIKEHALTEKDSVLVSKYKENLIISSKFKKVKKITEISIVDIHRSLALSMIQGKYIEGYDTMIIKHNNLELAHEIGNAFTGMIVEEQTESKLVLQDIIGIPNDNFLNIFRRSGQMLIQLTRELPKIVKGEITRKNIKQSERTLDKHLGYCLRYINKYQNIDNHYKYFLLVSTLESVGDLINEIAVEIDNNDKISKDDKNNIKELIHTIEYYIVYLFENNLKKSHTLIKQFRKKIIRKTFLSGIVHCISEELSNYNGYVFEK